MYMCAEKAVSHFRVFVAAIVVRMARQNGSPTTQSLPIDRVSKCQCASAVHP